MRRAALLSVLATSFASLLLSPAGATTRPALRLVDAPSLVLRGSGFAAREHVRVTVYAGTETGSKRVTTTATGRFRVGFPTLGLDPCVGFGASAVGDRGSRASFKHAPGMCPVP